MNRKNTPFYKFAKYLCEKYDEVDNIKYVAYFFETVSFQIIETIIILLVSNYLGLLGYTLVSMLGFLITRSMKNGYHAKTTIGCMIQSLILFMAISTMGIFCGYLGVFVIGLLVGLLLQKRN